jgi:hypothetical protein
MLTTSRLALAISVSLMLVPFATPAFAIELDPGMWQDTETGEEDGKPVKPEITSDCMTPEEAKDPVKSLSVMKDTAGQCKKLDVKQSGNTVSIVMLCGDPKEMSIDLTGTYTFLDKRHYTGTMKSVIIIAGKKTTASKTVESKWIGACKK